MSCLRCAHLYRLWWGRGAGHPAPTPGCDAAPRVTLPRCVGLCPGGQVLVHQPAGPRAPSERVSSVSLTETHVKATPAPLRVGGPPRLGGEGAGLLLAGTPCQGQRGAHLSCPGRTGRTCHPPVKDEELEGSSVSLGQGISDTAAGSSGPVPTACMCQGPVGVSQGWGASANVYGRADEGGVRRIRWRQSLLGKGWFLKF